MFSLRNDQFSQKTLDVSLPQEETRQDSRAPIECCIHLLVCVRAEVRDTRVMNRKGKSSELLIAHQRAGNSLATTLNSLGLFRWPEPFLLRRRKYFPASTLFFKNLVQMWAISVLYKSYRERIKIRDCTTHIGLPSDWSLCLLIFWDKSHFRRDPRRIYKLLKEWVPMSWILSTMWS